MVVVTDKEKKRLAEKHNKLLAELVKQPDNSTCADCGASGPRWASWNLGVFLCIRCGGQHRSIGTHITKVKSINLDNWTPEQIEHFRHIGNRRANAYFNPHPERHPAPRSDRDIERYIRDKYERRLFVDHHNGVSDPTVASAAGQDASPQQTAPAAGQASNTEASALTRLHEMGFRNVRDNHQALKRFSFNVEAAAAYLRGETAKPKITRSDHRVQQLLNMGFEHVGQNIRALEECDGDVSRAIELLLSDNPPARASVSPISPVSKATPAAAPVATAAATAATVDLLDSDFFGAASPAAPSQLAASPPAPPKGGTAAAAAASAGLTDLFGGMSLASSSTPAAAAAAQSSDPFGDFGDFLSATSAPSTSAAKAPSLAPSHTPASSAAPSAASAPAPAPAAATQTAGQAGQNLFDNDFIMSLYAKSPAPNSTGAAASQFGAPAQASSGTGNTPKGASGGDAFSGLDFFM